MEYSENLGTQFGAFCLRRRNGAMHFPFSPMRSYCKTELLRFANWAPSGYRAERFRLRWFYSPFPTPSPSNTKKWLSPLFMIFFEDV